MAYNLKNENIHEIFTMEYMRIIEKINYLISSWKERWIHAEKIPPILTLCGRTITDTRFSDIKNISWKNWTSKYLNCLNIRIQKKSSRKKNIDRHEKSAGKLAPSE